MFHEDNEHCIIIFMPLPPPPPPPHIEKHLSYETKFDIPQVLPFE